MPDLNGSTSPLGNDGSLNGQKMQPCRDATWLIRTMQMRIENASEEHFLSKGIKFRVSSNCVKLREPTGRQVRKPLGEMTFEEGWEMRRALPCLGGRNWG